LLAVDDYKNNEKYRGLKALVSLKPGESDIFGKEKKLLKHKEINYKRYNHHLKE